MKLWGQVAIQKVLRKAFTILIFIGVLFLVTACGGSEDPHKVFTDKLTKAESYKASGVIESHFDSGRKQNDFTVYYKYPELIKVEIKSGENSDKQIILKNTEGVYILIPAVNKNFKIQSDWPANASYPYLLQSIAKDIANDSEAIVTEDEATLTIETKTKMHADATATKQKVIFDKTTNLPKEVLIYDENDALYIRSVYTNIDFDYNISDDEFDLKSSMTAVRLELDDKISFEGREIRYPAYIPEGLSLASESIKGSSDGLEKLAIMKYGTEMGFTLIQEFVNDDEVTRYQEEKGEIILVLGNIAILKSASIQTIYQGVEYTIASSDFELGEMLKVVQSFMVVADNK